MDQRIYRSKHVVDRQNQQRQGIRSSIMHNIIRRFKIYDVVVVVVAVSAVVVVVLCPSSLPSILTLDSDFDDVTFGDDMLFKVRAGLGNKAFPEEMTKPERCVFISVDCV